MPCCLLLSSRCSEPLLGYVGSCYLLCKLCLCVVGEQSLYFKQLRCPLRAIRLRTRCVQT